MQNKSSTRYTLTGAVIATIYVVLTLLSNVFSLAFGPIQLRLSEALCVLPIFTPAAIPGLTLGCLISNIFSFNALDIVFGTAATAVSAILTCYLARYKTFGLPLPALLPPVLINAAVIGFETAFFMAGNIKLWPLFALQIAVGEAICCYGAGIPLYLYLNRGPRLF